VAALKRAVEVELETVGGPVRAWFYPRRAFVKVVASDAESKEVLYRCHSRANGQ
jgi:hypothetical protein